MEIVFYKSKENLNHYLLFRGANGVNAEKMLQKLTNTGEFENSGYDRVDVELAFILKTNLNGEFFEFVVENISTNHIPHPFYDGETFRAWYEFKNYEPEKWLEHFNTFQNTRIEELMKNSQQGLQTTLFDPHHFASTSTSRLSRYTR